MSVTYAQCDFWGALDMLSTAFSRNPSCCNNNLTLYFFEMIVMNDSVIVFSLVLLLERHDITSVMDLRVAIVECISPAINIFYCACMEVRLTHFQQIESFPIKDIDPTWGEATKMMELVHQFIHERKHIISMDWSGYPKGEYDYKPKQFCIYVIYTIPGSILGLSSKLLPGASSTNAWEESQAYWQGRQECLETCAVSNPSYRFSGLA